MRTVISIVSFLTLCFCVNLQSQTDASQRVLGIFNSVVAVRLTDSTWNCTGTWSSWSSYAVASVAVGQRYTAQYSLVTPNRVIDCEITSVTPVSGNRITLGLKYRGNVNIVSFPTSTGTIYERSFTDSELMLPDAGTPPVVQFRMLNHSLIYLDSLIREVGTVVVTTDSVARTSYANGLTPQYDIPYGDVNSLLKYSPNLQFNESQLRTLAFKITGTGGAGYLEVPTQSSTPSTPASGFVQFADASGRFSFKPQSDSFTRTFNGTLTADRLYSLQNSSGTFPLLEAAQTFTAINTFSPSGSGAAGFIYNSTTRPSHPIPSMTTVQRDALTGMVAGDQIYNTTTNRNNHYNGTAWVESPSVTSGGLGNNQIARGDASGNIFGDARLTYVSDYLFTVKGASYPTIQIQNDAGTIYGKLESAGPYGLFSLYSTGGTQGLSLSGQANSLNNYLHGSLQLGAITGKTSFLDVSPNQSGGDISGAGYFFRIRSASVQNNVSPASTTITSASLNSFDGGTIASTNTGIVYTNAATLRIASAPTAGTNTTITNPLSLWVAGGKTLLGSSSPNQTLASLELNSLAITNGTSLAGSFSFVQFWNAPRTNSTGIGTTSFNQFVSTGATGSGYGIVAEVTANGGGFSSAATNAYGIFTGATFGNTGGGLISNVGGIRIANSGITGAGATNYYGIRIDDHTQGSVGTATNSYGLYIGLQTHANLTVTNPYGIYQAGATSNNYFAGKVGIGISAPATTALLDLTSTTLGFLKPRLTTVQRDAIVSPATGLEIYNITNAQNEYYNGTAWVAPMPFTSSFSYGTNRVLYSNASSTISTTPNFQYDSGTNALSVGSITTTNTVTSNGNAVFLSTRSGIASQAAGILTIGGAPFNDGVELHLIATHGSVPAGDPSINFSTVNTSWSSPTATLFTYSKLYSVVSYDAVNFTHERGDIIFAANAYTLGDGSGTQALANRISFKGRDGSIIIGGLAVSNHPKANIDVRASSVFETVGNAVIRMDATNQGFLPPRLTTAQRNSMNGTISSIKVTWSGNFTSVPAVIVGTETGGGIGATFTPVLSGGSTGTITSVTVNNAGSGYRYKPIVYSSGGGSNASFEPVINPMPEDGLTFYNTDTKTNQYYETTSNSWRDVGSYQSGKLGVGTISPVSSALVEITSTTQGLLIPRMTTVQRDAITSPATGLSLYNTSTARNNYYNGTSWVEEPSNFTSTRIPFGSGINGGLTESANLTFVSGSSALKSNQYQLNTTGGGYYGTDGNQGMHIPSTDLHFRTFNGNFYFYRQQTSLASNVINTQSSRLNGNVAAETVSGTEASDWRFSTQTIQSGGSRGNDLIVRGGNSTQNSAPTAVVAGDVIIRGGLQVGGTLGASWDHGQIIFETAPNASGAVLAERMRITQSGTVSIGSSTGAANIAFQVVSSDKMSIPAPVMTSTLRDLMTGIEAGTIYSSSSSEYQFFDANFNGWVGIVKKGADAFFTDQSIIYSLNSSGENQINASADFKYNATTGTVSVLAEYSKLNLRREPSDTDLDAALTVRASDNTSDANYALRLVKGVDGGGTDSVGVSMADGDLFLEAHTRNIQLTSPYGYVGPSGSPFVQSRTQHNGSGSLQLSGRQNVAFISATASYTDITLPSIVAGTPGTNEVRIGHELTVIVVNASSMTIYAGAATAIYPHGASTTPVSSVSTTGGTTYAIKFVAADTGKWFILGN